MELGLAIAFSALANVLFFWSLSARLDDHTTMLKRILWLLEENEEEEKPP